MNFSTFVYCVIGLFVLSIILRNGCLFSLTLFAAMVMSGVAIFTKMANEQSSNTPNAKLGKSNIELGAMAKTGTVEERRVIVLSPDTPRTVKLQFAWDSDEVVAKEVARIIQPTDEKLFIQAIARHPSPNVRAIFEERVASLKARSDEVELVNGALGILILVVFLIVMVCCFRAYFEGRREAALRREARS
jgi:hypothetical protein